MSYSTSTFTVEINGVSAIAFEAKWHARAEQICRLWTQQHWEQLMTPRSNGLDWPPFVKLRLAHVDEKAAYEAANQGAEFHDEVRVVYLIDMRALPWAK